MIRRNSLHWRRGFVLTAIPAILIALFYLLRRNSALMNGWTHYILRPFAQTLGQIWRFLPFSVGELMIALALIGAILFLVYSAITCVRNADAATFARRILSLVAAALWIWALFCWMWNCVYGAKTFAAQSGLDLSPYSVEELFETTLFFAQKSAEYADQMPRDQAGSYVGDRSAFFRSGASLYAELEAEFPFLSMPPVACKPIFFSKLQSNLGFTGFYFPLTGEANVNIDAPVFFCPLTIAHEMAHQRMIAQEQEANFLGIAACVKSDDPAFVYSGYLYGLIQLCNALYPVAPDLWNEIVTDCFTPEMLTDWRANNDYWRALESPAQENAEQVYDNFLKGNNQQLGIRSYGACVDLLVAYFGSGKSV